MNRARRSIVRILSGATAATLLLATAAPADAAPRRRKPEAVPAEPIERTPEAAPEVAAPEADTIPEDLTMPEVEPEGPRTFEGGDTEYQIMSTGDDVVVDEDVLDAQQELPDPAVLRRKAKISTGVGAPIVALGLSGLVGGMVLGTFNRRVNMDARDWVPIMLAGAGLLAVGTPLLVRGVVLKREAKETEEFLAEQEQAMRLAPSFGRSNEGTWTAGVAGRF